MAIFSRSTFFFAIQSTPVDGATWRQQIIDHRGALDDDAVIEAMSELAYLEAGGMGKHVSALEIADQAVALAEATGHELSPWASAARAHALCMAARYSEAVLESERALQLADSISDEAAAVVALNNLSASLAGLDDRERGASVAREGLRRGEESGHPLHLGAAVISYAALYLTQTAAPDFEASWEVLKLHAPVPRRRRHQCDVARPVLGLVPPRARRQRRGGWLAHAAGAADRLNAQHVSDLALRLLALALDHCGLSEEARILAHYASANLEPFRFPAPGQTWIDQRIEPMTPTGSSWDGAENKRGEIMALVNKTTFSISHPDSGSDHDSPPTR